MNKLYALVPKKTLILMVGLLIIIATLVVIVFVRKPKESPALPTAVISQSPSPLFPTQKSTIGKTTVNDIEKKYSVNHKQVLANGDLEYSFNSQIEARPDQIVFRNNVAEFERTVILSSTVTQNYLKISDQILKYGPTERIVKGSKFYGCHMDTYIYASKGFTFTANANTDEVYEIQTFLPTSVDNYLANYGQDIQKCKEIKEGG